MSWVKAGHFKRVGMPPLKGQVELEQIKYFSWSWKEAVTSLPFLTLGGMNPGAAWSDRTRF